MQVNLRDYQLDALDRIRDLIRAGRRRILIVSPTDSGKTTIAGSIIGSARERGNRCIFLAHRKELIEQCSSRLDDMNIDHAIIKSGNKRSNIDEIVQVASIQTLINRDHWDAKLIVVDEAHRTHSKSYISLLKRYDNPIVLGLTATPYRLDGKGLRFAKNEDGEKYELYEELVEVSSVQQLIDEGFLIMPTVFGAPVINKENIKLDSNGEYKKDQAASAMGPSVYRGDLIKNWVKHCGKALNSNTEWDGDRVIKTDCDACTVVFAPSIELSKNIVEQFREIGVAAAHLDGKTPQAERDKILKDLRSRKIKVVSNYEILTEGWDLPHLECVIAARLTQSRMLVKQMVGRLMRPDDNKRFAFLLDHADWTRSHGHVNQEEAYSLDGKEGRSKKGDGGGPIRECPECTAILPINLTNCPECGYEFPRREVKFSDEELVVINPIKRVINASIEERQEAFNTWCARCVEMEYKPNWVMIQYQKKYGEWPMQSSGIKYPKFFWKYKESFKKKLELKMATQNLNM